MIYLTVRSSSKYKFVSHPALVVERDVKGVELVEGVPCQELAKEVISEKGAKVPLHVEHAQFGGGTHDGPT